MKNQLVFMFLINIFTLIKSYNFYSNSFFTNSNKINSNYFGSNNLFYNSNLNYNSYSLPTTSTNKNKYISYVISYNFQPSNNLFYSLSMPSLEPTLVPYITLAPSITPSLAPTLSPTFYPSLIIKETIKPTSITVPIISFDTKLSFANYDTTDLDEKSQNAIIIATANSMNLSISFITYKGCEIQTRRSLNSFLFFLQGYNIVVSLQTNIPLQGKFSSFINNPNTLYSSITTNLINSVNSGVFTSYLQTASLNLNITSFANSTISSVESDEYTILIPKNDKGSNTHKLDINSIIYVILFSGGIIVLLLISYHFKGKEYYFSCIRTHINLTDINLTDINLTENV